MPVFHEVIEFDSGVMQIGGDLYKAVGQRTVEMEDGSTGIASQLAEYRPQPPSSPPPADEPAAKASHKQVLIDEEMMALQERLEELRVKKAAAHKEDSAAKKQKTEDEDPWGDLNDPAPVPPVSGDAPRGSSQPKFRGAGVAPVQVPPTAYDPRSVWGTPAGINPKTMQGKASSSAGPPVSPVFRDAPRGSSHAESYEPRCAHDPRHYAHPENAGRDAAAAPSAWTTGTPLDRAAWAKDRPAEWSSTPGAFAWTPASSVSGEEAARAWSSSSGRWDKVPSDWSDSGATEGWKSNWQDSWTRAGWNEDASVSEDASRPALFCSWCKEENVQQFLLLQSIGDWQGGLWMYCHKCYLESDGADTSMSIAQFKKKSRVMWAERSAKAGKQKDQSRGIDWKTATQKLGNRHPGQDKFEYRLQLKVEVRRMALFVGSGHKRMTEENKERFNEAMEELTENLQKIEADPTFVPELTVTQSFWCTEDVLDFSSTVMEGADNYYLCRNEVCIHFTPNTNWCIEVKVWEAFCVVTSVSGEGPDGRMYADLEMAVRFFGDMLAEL